MMTYKKWSITWTPLFVISAIIISRLYAYLFFENLNIYNDSGVSIRLAGTPAFLDYVIYKNHISTAWSEITRPLNFFAFLIEDWRGAIDWLRSQSLKPGPLFPMMLGLSGYEEGRCLLSFVYQIAGAVLGWHWAKQLRERGEALWLQVLSACFPALVYYAFLVSTDLLYACLIAIWLIGARAVLVGKTLSYSWTSAAMLLLLLTRPNSLALLPLMSLLALRGKNFRAWLSWSFFGRPLVCICSSITCPTIGYTIAMLAQRTTGESCPPSTTRDYGQVSLHGFRSLSLGCCLQSPS